MFGALLDKTTGWLDQRLITTILLPALAFWAGLGALVATHAGWAATVRHWSELDGPRQLLAAAGAVAALVLFSMFAQVLLPAIIRAYEGYWLLDTVVGRWLVGRRLRRWAKLDLTRPRDFTRRYQEFPPDQADLLPTRFGTVLRAAEAYAGDPRRYGMDAVFFWPRLYPLLPDPLRQSLTAARSSVDQLLFTATLCAAFVVATAVLAVAPGLPATVWLPALLGTAGLGLLSQHAAVRVAVSYGELVRAAFDIHRRALLTAMGLEAPATLEAERDLWKAVGQLLYRGDADRPELIVYARPTQATATEMRASAPPFTSGRG